VVTAAIAAGVPTALPAVDPSASPAIAFFSPNNFNA